METNPVPAPSGESIADNSNQPNQPAESAQPAQTQPAPDMHGFTSEELADMRKFFDNNGGFAGVKSRISNPTSVQEPQPQQPQQSQSQQSQPQPQPQQPAKAPEGYTSMRDLMVEQYINSVAADPKYATISNDIRNGKVINEMTEMGIYPIDEQGNVNVRQLTQFLDLKAASVPAKPTSVEPTNIPTVDYVYADQDITNQNQALEILRQSFALEHQGQSPHPSATKAREFLQKNGLKLAR